MNLRIVLLLAMLVTGLPLFAENEIGFVERFALATDRDAVLQELIPGTEDHYYFHALHYQVQGRRAEFDGVLEQWRKRFPDSGRRKEFENRQALLDYSTDPQGTLEYLKRELGLTFQHERERKPEERLLPTRLDPAQITAAAFAERALAGRNDLGQAEDRALEFLVRQGAALSPAQVRELLQRVARPDFPKLVDLILAELAETESRGFGSLPAHNILLLDQLERLAARRPDLKSASPYVFAYLARLAPGDDTDLESDPAVRAAYLDRVWTFVQSLEPSFNSLKANILYQILDLRRSRGEYPADLFQNYLALPRPVPYIRPQFLQEHPDRGFAADLNADFRQIGPLPPIGFDEPLVRDYLLALLADAPDFEAYRPYLEEGWLKRVFAEAKITGGVGNPEQWFSLISPTEYQALKDRVDIDFAPANPQRFGVGDPVRLRADVKNVASLIVKVYELNTLNFYLTQKREIGTDVDLDGLVPNEETVQTFDNANPFRRTRRDFEFPSLEGRRGVWIIELIGNGKSSRALIRKGGLQSLGRTSTAGRVLSVLNEANEPVPSASVWLGDREFKADAEGAIVLPFSAEPGPQPAVLYDGAGFASLETLQLEGENYAFQAGFLLSREQLLSRREASLVLRPSLTLNGEPVTLSVLEKLRLTLVSTDLDGNVSTDTIDPFPLEEGREAVHVFRVPDRLARLRCELSAEVPLRSRGDTRQGLSSSHEIALNGLQETDQVLALHLAASGGARSLHVLGRNGEPAATVPVTFTLLHRLFRNPHTVTLQTDDAGSIQLGDLSGLARITAEAPGAGSRSWDLPRDAATLPGLVQAAQGEPVRLTYPGTAAAVSREMLSLFETRRGVYVRDLFDRVSLADGSLLIRDLEPGDYSLWLKEPETQIAIRVAEGQRSGRFVLGQRRHLRTGNPEPLAIRSVDVTRDQVVIDLGHPGAFTRVHVTADRFEPALPALGPLQPALPPLFAVTRASLLSAYVSGRRLGDEYRYIIDRKYLPRRPGNLAERPALLLNPWAVRTTDTGTAQAEEGEAYDRQATGAAAGLMAEPSAKEAAPPELPGDPVPLEFLAEPGLLLANLVPDENGRVVLDRAALGDRHHLRIVAVDPQSAVLRHLALDAAEPQLADLRLAAPLQAGESFAEDEEVLILRQGETLTVEDVRATRLEYCDTLDKAFRILQSLRPDPTLEEFSFILQWPKLSAEEKRARYSKYASHELHAFLAGKDPEFFREVMNSYLPRKLHPTFLDDYLTGADLQTYLEPWSFGLLNTAEKAFLARRADPGDRATLVRHLDDLFGLLPPQPSDRFAWFGTALGGSGLQARLGEFEAALMEAPPAAPAAAAGGEMQAGRRMRFAGRPGAANALADKSLGVEEKAKAETAAAMGVEALQRGAQVEGEDLGLARDEARSLSRLAADANAPSEDAVYKKDAMLRKAAEVFYQRLDQTQEWAENNYHHLPLDQQTAGLIAINRFWRDFAAWDGTGAFLSIHFPEASRNFAETMLALAALDLPFEAAEHETTNEGARFTLKAGSDLIVFRRHIRPAPRAEDPSPLLLSQNFFRKSELEQARAANAPVPFLKPGSEFLVSTVYGCELVVTNPSSAPWTFDLLAQIPQGALPLAKAKPTQSWNVRLDPYATFRQEILFYFPSPGSFSLYPATLAVNGNVAGQAGDYAFAVRAEPSTRDTQSWEYLSQWGTDDEVFTFLGETNLLRLDLGKAAWRMREAGFFRRMIDLLEQRHVYHDTLYSYALLHNDTAAARSYLRHAAGFLAACGPYLQSDLAIIDPVERRAYQHLEYAPLVNARAHVLGGERRILNTAFHEQYHRLMTSLAYRKDFSAEEQLAVCYYLFLQDRVEEALARFEQVDAASLRTSLQYDYFQTYAALYREQPAEARAVAGRYRDYPVDRWRTRFVTVLEQLDEIEGAGAELREEQAREQQQNALAARTPALDLAVEGQTVTVTHRNLPEITVNYYRMDIEFLFSSSPFVTQDSGRFSIIKPNLSEVRRLDPAAPQTAFPLPREFAGQNVLIEVLGGGLRRAQASYSNALDLQLSEPFGRLEVAHAQDHRPLPKVYVKVYARYRDGRVAFFKDGYTDLRGRFDYTSLSTNELEQVDRFALLILSDEHGASVKEANPPQQ